jgi:medium-chain acyl-[acyl-carrier-protein] hydrolase
VQLPGRETRLREAPFLDLDTAIAAVTGVLQPLLDRPYALFGHSMGALLAFEVARTLIEKGQRPPAHLFVSGRRAPHITSHGQPPYELPDNEFLDYLRRLNGTPEEVLRHKELMDFYLPIIRADFRLAHNYEYRAAEPLPVPITALGGRDDPAASEDGLRAWQRETARSFDLHILPGDHFYIGVYPRDVVRIITDELGEIVDLSAGMRAP